MTRYVEYVDFWPSPNRTAAITRHGETVWRVVLTSHRRPLGRRVVFAQSLTSAQGKARTFVKGQKAQP